MFNTSAVVILYSSMLLIIAVCVWLTLYTLRPVGVEGFSDDKSSIEFNSCKLLRRYIKMGKKEALERAILNVQSVITGWQMRSIWEPAIHQTGAYVLNIFFHTWSTLVRKIHHHMHCMQQKVVYNYLLTKNTELILWCPYPTLPRFSIMVWSFK